MNNISQLLGITSLLSLSEGGNNNNNSNESNNDAFGLVMSSLLRAIASKPKTNSVTNSAANSLTNNMEFCTCDKHCTNLNTQNTVVNTSKVQSSSGSKDTNTRIDNAINQVSKKYGVDQNLIRAIIKVESNFNPKVVSSAGAKGLMQLMPENCRDLGVKDPFNIEENIDAGTRHIKEYLDKYNGNPEMALMAYNGGPTRMARRGVKSINDIYKMPKETQKYVPKVMKYYKGI